LFALEVQAFPFQFQLLQKVFAIKQSISLFHIQEFNRKNID